MDGGDRPKTLWKNLKRRLRLNGLAACCGPSWNPRVSDVAVEEEEESAQYYVDEEEEPIFEAHYGPGRVNLAMVLEAERMGSMTPTTQFKTLMRLFEEADGRDEKKEEKEIDTVCCVCMERNKGAAFIPCGHTYCRICSRELWLNRGLCPLCNRPIDDILDIF
ncbi:uncharacterized protein LOC132639360 [Lycium barbarum]|uniref:uncharacterized protein LOC132639360 n=1 Tax=Lycium barbarum TaxID=112863 RepID=UPI00293EA3E7|nr:uncharacterized protein LOC132639360 [Lycium barbarum]